MLWKFLRRLPTFLDGPTARKTSQDLQLKLAAMGHRRRLGAAEVAAHDPTRCARPPFNLPPRSLITLVASTHRPSLLAVQGRFENNGTASKRWFAGRGAESLAARAHTHGVPLLFEPLNRYESNLINCVADGVALLNRSRQRREACFAICFT